MNGLLMTLRFSFDRQGLRKDRKSESERLVSRGLLQIDNYGSVQNAHILKKIMVLYMIAMIGNKFKCERLMRKDLL